MPCLPCWPLAVMLARHSWRTYRRGHITLRDGRRRDLATVPIRFWIDVAGSLVLAIALAAAGSTPAG
ncbi:hypothetical protein [Cupriavidus sp. CuC1]|uniref:hypothetical protein n=1 Tax=Cupriavidus sp. CuC1 TaxID=3373131 RepID=UPI0037CFEE32